MSDLSDFLKEDSNITGIRVVKGNFIDGSTTEYLTNGRSNYLLYVMSDVNCYREYFFEDGSRFNLNYGDVLFIPAQTKYKTIVHIQNGKICTSIGISFDIRSNTGEFINIDTKPRILYNGDNGYFMNMFRDMLTFFSRKSENMYALKGELYKIISIIFSNCDNKITKSILPAVEYIQKNIDKKITIKELADICFMSENNFRRIFTIYTNGISPIQYILKLKMELASEYAQKGYSLLEIADKLGLYDSAYLSKTYKKITGHTLKGK